MTDPTPGPWSVAGLDQHAQRIVKGEHIEICTCWHHSVGSLEKQMEANAELIASAPETAAERDRLQAVTADLVTATLALIQASLDMKDAWDQPDAYLNFENAVVAAEAAIRKTAP